MEKHIETTKQEIEEFLMNDEEHSNKHIDYILIKNKTGETYTLASDEAGEEAIEFTPYTKDHKNGYGYVPEWEYNFDYYIFGYLDEDYSIGYMTNNIHYNLWNSIHELYPNDIENKDGVKKYLKYCKDNNITKEFIDRTTNFDTPDVMYILGDMSIGSTLGYKGYIAVVDENNFDNPNEILVDVFKSGSDVRLETVSLNKNGLEKNIRDYINKNYNSKNKDLER